jgi:acyl carrier protein
MTKTALWDSLNEVFRDVMDDPSIVVGESTTAADIEEWDSLAHILLIVAIEKKFSIRFTAGEIQSFENVGELAALVQQRSV